MVVGSKYGAGQIGGLSGEGSGSQLARRRFMDLMIILHELPKDSINAYFPPRPISSIGGTFLPLEN